MSSQTLASVFTSVCCWTVVYGPWSTHYTRDGYGQGSDEGWLVSRSATGAGQGYVTTPPAWGYPTSQCICTHANPHRPTPHTHVRSQPCSLPRCLLHAAGHAPRFTLHCYLLDSMPLCPRNCISTHVHAHCPCIRGLVRTLSCDLIRALSSPLPHLATHVHSGSYAKAVCSP